MLKVKRRKILIFFGIFIPVFLLNFLFFTLAWSGPSLSPPGGDATPFLNESSTTQYKDGRLNVSGVFEALGVKLFPDTATRPTCNSTNRGMFWLKDEGPIWEDGEVQICLKNSANVYNWEKMYLKQSDHSCYIQQEQNIAPIADADVYNFVTPCPSIQDWSHESYTPEIWRDNTTGLFWTEELACSINWHDSKSLCENMTYGGRTGWRLPTKDEIMQVSPSNSHGYGYYKGHSIVTGVSDGIYADKWTQSDVFTGFNTNGYLWAINEKAANSSNAWWCRPSNGSCAGTVTYIAKTSANAVNCVRCVTREERPPCPATFTDTRDSNTYSVMDINGSCVMSENLRYLPSVVGPATGSDTDPYYYVYGYDGTSVSAAKATSNYSTYGVLYNWPAGYDNACPSGWRMPNCADMYYRESFFAGNGLGDQCVWNRRGTYECIPAGSRLAGNASLWNAGALKSHADFGSSGFNWLPGGYRYTDATYVHLGAGSGFWGGCSDAVDTGFSWHLAATETGIYRNVYEKGTGNYIRCVRE